jgi:TonB family protein
MTFSRVCLLLLAAVVAHSQSASDPAETAHLRLSVADFGLVYPLNHDWVRATELLRKRLESSNSVQSFDFLLAAVYVPKSDLSVSSPFFSLLAYRQPATDCRKNLEGMIAYSQDNKDKPQSGIIEFSAGGRGYFRVNMAHGSRGRHQCMICTAANGHLLIWNAGAPNEKGLDSIVATLGSIAPLPQRSDAESAQSARPTDDAVEGIPSNPVAVRPAELPKGLWIKKVPPKYPEEARRAYIQGTVMLQVEIDKTGDVTVLELLDGPIELAGSAVAAVRQWKYKPYLLLGQPVDVITQIQVNYELRQP